MASFVRLVVTDESLIPTAGHGRWYYIESYRASFNEVFAEAQNLDGQNKPWKITRSSADPARSLQTSDSAEGESAWHLALIDEGYGLRQTNDNDEIGFKPSHHFQDAVEEALLKARS